MHFRHRQMDRRADGLASWHKRKMYILHLVLKKGGKGKGTIIHHLFNTDFILRSSCNFLQVTFIFLETSFPVQFIKKLPIISVLPQ